MGFAERLAISVVTDNLEHNETKTMPVELVASLSGASSLGSDMMRSADYDGAALRRALLLLTRDAVKRLNMERGFAFKLALAAIQETLHGNCRQCHGSGQVVAGELKIICPRCKGNGIHRWTDKERSAAAKVRAESWPKCEKKYLAVLAMVTDDYLRTPIAARHKLGDK